MMNLWARTMDLIVLWRVGLLLA